MKGILFSDEMVRAILDGRKTMTRRVIVPQPSSRHLYWEEIKPGWFQFDNGETGEFRKSRYLPGEIVYVKETWAILDGMRHFSGTWARAKELGLNTFHYKADALMPNIGPWRSPRFMPQWAARLFLLIKAVRAERIQDITHFDAQCEGAKMAPDDELREYGYRAGFKQLWDSINGKKHPWKNNDYVWVYEFERVEVSTNES